MRRGQRRTHVHLWPLIGLAMIAVLAVAFVVREHPAPHISAPVEGTP